MYTAGQRVRIHREGPSLGEEATPTYRQNRASISIDTNPTRIDHQLAEGVAPLMLRLLPTARPKRMRTRSTGAAPSPRSDRPQNPVGSPPAAEPRGPRDPPLTPKPSIQGGHKRTPSHVIQVQRPSGNGDGQAGIGFPSAAGSAILAQAVGPSRLQFASGRHPNVRPRSSSAQADAAHAVPRARRSALRSPVSLQALM